MGELEFDWESAGVTAKRDWTDSQTFSNIAAGVEGLDTKVYSSIISLPVDTVGGPGKTDNAGRSDLRRESAYVIEVVNLIMLELSDACATLGSGTDSAASNFDAAETTTTQDFDFLTGEVAG